MMNNSVAEMMELGNEYADVMSRARQAWVGTSVLRVSGRDRTRWLHKLITADVEHLEVGQGVYAALLEAKGHFVADFVVLALGDSFLLLVDPAARDLLLRSLRRYIIRDQVQVDNESDRWTLLTLVGRESDRAVEAALHAAAPAVPFYAVRAAFASTDVILVRATRAPMPATDLIVPREQAEALSLTVGAPQMSAELVELLRIEAGLPRWGADFDDKTLALEIPEVLSIRVDQGCYIGQEIVARLVHRGHVNRHLVGLKLESSVVPAPGTAVYHGDNPVGAITSSALSPRLGVIALGYVRREFAEPGTALRLEAGDPAQVCALPFEEGVSVGA